jgi:hypothetical protein
MATTPGGTARPSAFGSLEIDDELEFRRQHDGQITRPLTFENPANVNAGLAIRICSTGSITNEAASFNNLAICVERWHRVVCSQCD